MAKSTETKSFTDRVTEPLKNAGETLKNAGAKAAENGQALNLSVISHAEANAREAFNALRAAAQATSLTDVMKVQTDFVRAQGARSMEQAKELGELIARFGREAIAPMMGKKD